MSQQNLLRLACADDSCQQTGLLLIIRWHSLHVLPWGCGCRGSRLHEVAAAGCAVVTGSCSAVFLEAYDLNQAAVRAAEEWDLSAESPMSTSPSQEDQRCLNPTPRRAAG